MQCSGVTLVDHTSSVVALFLLVRESLLLRPFVESSADSFSRASFTGVDGDLPPHSQEDPSSDCSLDEAG